MQLLVLFPLQLFHQRLNHLCINICDHLIVYFISSLYLKGWIWIYVTLLLVFGPFERWCPGLQ